MAQYVYTMNQVGKIVPPRRRILEDISLSFFPGAKIGVLGLNGSGKSSLLRIMAGEDREYEGEARPQAGIKVGFLPQEPQLDPEKDVRGNAEEGLGEAKTLLDRFNNISEKFAEPMEDDEMTALLEEQGKLQDAIDAVGGWELDRKLEIAADALRLPPGDAMSPVKLQYPVGRIIQKIPVMGHGDDRAGVFNQEAFQPGYTFCIEMIGRLVQ